MDGSVSEDRIGNLQAKRTGGYYAGKTSGVFPRQQDHQGHSNLVEAIRSTACLIA